MSYTCIEINQVQLIRMFLFFDKQFIITFITFEDIKSNELVIFSSSLISFSIQSCRSCYAPLHLCQRSFNKLFVKVRNSKKNVSQCTINRYIILFPTLIIKSRDASVILFPTINDKSSEPSNEIIRIIFYTKVCNIMSDSDY